MSRCSQSASDSVAPSARHLRPLTVIFGLGLAGCSSTYSLEAKLVQPQPAQPSQPVTPALVLPSDYYVRITADAEPQPGVAPESVCARAFWVPFAKTVAQAISLSAVLNDTGTTVPIPLYTVNSDTSKNTCDVAYSTRYILPNTKFADGQLFTIGIQAKYQITGKEAVSDYLKAGVSLAQNMAPNAIPALAAVSTIFNSTLVQNVENTINASILSAETSVGSSVVKLDFGNPPSPVSQTVSILIQQVPLDQNRNPQTDKANPLGTLTIKVQQILTVLGSSPPLGQVYPNYGGIETNTPVLIFPNITPQPLDALLNTGVNAGRIDAVSNLSPSATTTQVGTACKWLSYALNSLQLNRLDTTAFLWMVYAVSPFAVAHEDPTLSRRSACLTDDQRSLVKAMSLTSWLGPAPVSVPSPS